MEAVYHWVGVAVVWAVATFLFGLGIWCAWQRRPRTAFERRVNSAFTWVWVFVLGKRWHLPLEGALLLLSAYRGKKRLDSWERDIVAFIFRYNRRIGWKQPH